MRRILNKVDTPENSDCYEEVTVYYCTVTSSYFKQVCFVVKNPKNETRVYSERVSSIILEKVEDTKLNRKKVILLTNEL